MTKLTHSKEENRQAQLQAEATASHEAGQILHLKRLLVTLKQHYEKSLQQIQIQLQVEQNQRLAFQKELETVRVQLTESQNNHDEELQALRHQQNTLKELLKKAQSELNQRTEICNSDLPKHDQTEGCIEVEQLRVELNEAHGKIKAFEQEIIENKQQAQKEIKRLQDLVEEQKKLLEEQKQKNEFETVVPSTSSHHLRHELENLKLTLLQGHQETRALEARYVEILNEKIGLEHQCKQIQFQLEHQSSNLTAFQERMHGLEDRNKHLEVALQAKEAEWKQLSERFEEAIEMRIEAEQHLNHLEAIATNQENQLQEFAQQLQFLDQEKGVLESERDQLKNLLDESETRLKVAQQHLAKKVKESALLSERSEEQQMHLAEFAQTIEYQKMQIVQLQASVDLYQKQEKRLQEQLHEALKGTESQIVKWEEKYFHMYEKWQESEKRVKELKKFEEKHLQMQSLFANLGNFMEGALNSSTFVHFEPTISNERLATPAFPADAPLTAEPSPEISKSNSQEEKYDLFGMRQPSEPYNPYLFS